MLQSKHHYLLIHDSRTQESQPDLQDYVARGLSDIEKISKTVLRCILFKICPEVKKLWHRIDIRTWNCRMSQQKHLLRL